MLIVHYSFSQSQDVDEWKEFNRRLGEQYESEFVTIGQPSVGLNCCAFQSEHKTWRRCEIIKLLDDGRCEVNFFDIGLTVTVLPTQLAMLNTEFDEHKPFAVHCMLSTTSNDSECFADIAKLPYPFFVYVDRPSHAAQDVVLFYKVDERFVCVNNFFCEESSTESLPSSVGSVVLSGKSDATAPNSVVWNSKSDAPAPNATATHIQSNKTIVKIENIEAINRIYVSTTMTAEHYQQVHEDVQQFAHVAEMSNTMCSEDGQLWKENDYCLVQYERSKNRKEWFRGKIVDVKDDTVCLVYLRDVGKTIEVETSKLKKITPDLQKVRDAAFKCNLSSVELNDLYSGESVKDKLLELLQQYDSTAISIYGYQKEKGAFSIILWAANVVVQALSPPQYNWTNINQELVNLSYLTAIEPFSVDVDGEDNAICEYVYEEQNTDISLGQKVTDERNYVEDWLPSVPIEQSDFYGTPTYITRSCVIFILKHERKAVAEKMEQILEMKRVAGELKARDKWKVGFPCFVPFNDGRYYRGKILELWPEKGLCAVSLINSIHFER